MSAVKDLHIFQIATLAIFIFIGVAGVAFFATNKSSSSQDLYTAQVWGVLPKSVIDESLSQYRIQGTDPKFDYKELAEETFEQELLVAIAEGRGPDAIIFPNSMFYGQSGRLVTIPNESISAKTFSDTYIDAGFQFAVQGGVKALPLITDPLMMYWNTSMFSAAGLLNPPRNWTELAQWTNKIARKKDNGNIERAYVALGEYTNVDYAKRILFTLLGQVGVQIGYYNPQMSAYSSGLITSAEDGGERTRSVFTYYTEFANPVKSSYSWNRSFASSREAFLAGDLALYFGPGSEIEYMRSRNPNLTFRVAPVPQENPDRKIVHGKTYALGFLVTSKNINASIAELTKYLTTKEVSVALATAMNTAPARRDALSGSKAAQQDSNIGAIYESAVYARDWMDPNPVATNAVLKTLVESITSGRQTLFEAIQEGSTRLEGLY